jgi:hypothetical protein
LEIKSDNSGYRTRFESPAMPDLSFAFDGRTAGKNPIQASDFRVSSLDWVRA